MKRNVLLGVSGSVAASLTPKLYKELCQHFNIKVVATNSALKFFDSLELPKSYDQIIFTDEDEDFFWKKEKEVLHISLRNWADLIIIAPLSANTLAKGAAGMCDNLLTNLIRAWDPIKPMLLAPAMNTMMWENVLTGRAINTMERLYRATVISPIAKTLACGDEGMGAMENIGDIIEKIKSIFKWRIPINDCRGIPVDQHPGAFGFKRSYYYHTGVDLYCNEGDFVYAAQQGRVVNVEDFTGPLLGHTWWEATKSILVKGIDGTIVYGEVDPFVCVGDYIKKGQNIARVVRVLPKNKARPDINGHSLSMLHVELYNPHVTESISWHHNDVRNQDLLDPTEFLLEAFNKKLTNEK